MSEEFDGLFRALSKIFSASKKSYDRSKERAAQRMEADTTRSRFGVYGPWLEPLVAYANERDGSAARVVRWFRANVSQQATNGTILSDDLIRLIRCVVLPKDEIRESHVELFYVFVSRVIGEDLCPIEDCYELIEGYRDEEDGAAFRVQVVLADREDPDLSRTIKIYLDLAEKIAAYPEEAQNARAIGLAALRDELEAFIT